MAAISKNANKFYPSIPAITPDPESQLVALQSIKEALQTHERQDGNYLKSFIRFEELVDLGIINPEGDLTLTSSSSVTTLDGLSDVNLAAAANNDLLFKSGGNWIDTATLLTWDGITLTIAAGGAFTADQLNTVSTGIDVRSAVVSSTRIRLFDESGSPVEISIIGHEGDSILHVRNKINSGAVYIQGNSSGGVLRSLIQGDPDAAITLFNAGVAVSRCASVAAGSHELDRTGSGGWERVLTTSDLISTAPTAITVAASGWHRVAKATGSNGRGSFNLHLYTVGGSLEPEFLHIIGHKDWGVFAGIDEVYSSSTLSWLGVRVVDDVANSDAYVEVDFSAAITSNLFIWAQDTGYPDRFLPLSGALAVHAGPDIVRTTITLVNASTKHVEGLSASGAITAGSLEQTKIDEYSISNSSVGVVSNAVTCTYATAQSYEVDLAAATAGVTITLSGGPPTGDYGEMIIKVTQDSVARTLTWAGGVFKWPGGVIPVLSTAASAIDIFHFSTWDNGATWHGSVIQGNS